MEVVPMRLPRSNSPGTAVGLPYNRKNIEEWSRIDRRTGVREKAKIETDHWTARSSNAAHNYGKVIDSRERNNPDGSFKERQRKQMEVFQTKVPGGSMQVIRTQTVTTSSKKWTSTNDKGFGDLELPVNSLDLSSQKTKGSVGRSGSIGGRRPPTRPRSLISQSSNADTNAFREESSSAFRLCQRLHEQAREGMFREFNDFKNRSRSFNLLNNKDSDTESERSGVVITDVTNPDYSNDDVCYVKSNLNRQKSCSNENLIIESDNESLLRRSSKVRRSLQCHKQNQLDCDAAAEEYDGSPTKSLKERAAEIERLLRHGSSTYTSSSPDRLTESYGKSKFLKTKDCFISPEKLKEVRDRLKKSNFSDNEGKDDGIVTEKEESSSSSRINSFDYGLDSVNDTNKKPNINGTGSLESRSSNKNSTNATRTSEWYKRRKSYGFEQVDEYNRFDKFNNKKNHIDSSTDSGICQSTETMGIPNWSKNTDSFWNKQTKPESLALSSKSERPTSTVVTVRVKKDPTENFNKSACNQTSKLSPDKGINSVYLDGYSNDYFNYSGNSKKPEVKNKSHGYMEDSPLCDESVWNRKSPIPYSAKTAETRENLKSSFRSTTNPWISQLRGTKLMDRNWDFDQKEEETEHKKLQQQQQQQQQLTETYPKPALASQTKDDSNKPESETGNQKKGKKVEFCKTEVHFAAESGKFNIVETDGKPPPNDMFRRRRRSTGSIFSKNVQNLPEIKFGDSQFEKTMLTSNNNSESINDKIEAELQELSRIVTDTLPKPKERETDDYERKNSWLYDVAEEPFENNNNNNNNNNLTDSNKPKSILKNYRNSFLLGENEYKNVKMSELKENYARSPTRDFSTPVWKSTVTLKNKRFDEVYRKPESDKKLSSSDGETELQMRLKNLRKTDSDHKKLWENNSSIPRDKNEESTEYKRRSLPHDITFKNVSVNVGDTVNYQKMPISNDEMPKFSVAERIKQVEQMKSNNYSTKINFRSGEMTVVQNGATNPPGKTHSEDPKKTTTTTTTVNYWPNSGKNEHFDDVMKKETRLPRERTVLSCDELTTSNPPVMRFSTPGDKTDDNQNYQTTRILINLKTSAKDDTTNKHTDIFSSEKDNKTIGCGKTSGKTINTYGSWSSGMKRDFDRYVNDLKSTSLVKKTTQNPSLQDVNNDQTIQGREDMPKLSKTVHEIIDQFDSLSKTVFKPKTRKPIPTVYKSSKEYTHSDLEEELKNFTDNLDKDFKDIYEEEIGSLRKTKSLRERKFNRFEETSRKNYNDNRTNVNPWSNYASNIKSSSDEGSKKSSIRTSSKDNYDTDDSDLLADEEVRSYMSTGHGGSDSETDGAFGSVSSRKSFEDSMLRFKKLESNINKKEIKNNAEPIQPATIYPKSNPTRKYQDVKPSITSPKIGSVAFKYEDDDDDDGGGGGYYLRRRQQENNTKLRPYQSNTRSNGYDADTRERSLHSSSSKPRERVSYLNDLSLSEKYSKYLQRSSVSSTDTISDGPLEKLERNKNYYVHNNNNESDEEFDKTKGNIYKNDNCSRRYKSPNRKSYRESPREDDKKKYAVDENYVREKSKTNSSSRHSNKTDRVGETRQNYKSNSEKLMNHEYVNEYQIKSYRTEKGKQREKNQTDEELEELKRAADQILMAVNGYTDDSSLVGSSEEERSRRIIRKDKINNLDTISEGKRVLKTDAKRSMTTTTTSSSHKKMNGNQSSASSVESLTKESMRPSRDSKSSSRIKSTSNSKPSTSRSTRLLQRATSREAIMGHPSSSEDIPSYLEESKRRIRRQKCSTSTSKSEAQGSSEKKENSSRHHRTKSKKLESSTSSSHARHRSTEKMKESSSNLKRATRSSHAPEIDKTKTTIRKILPEKPEVESIKKRRSQRIASREDYSSTRK